MERKHMSNPHARVARNCNGGRDFVAGDVHGEFIALEHLLERVEFAPERDRLFSVGDLIDRGPHSASALKWMESGRITLATRGNHEQWLLERLDAQASGEYDAAWRRERWSDAEIEAGRGLRWASIFRAMPLTATVDTAHGAVGIVHAAPVHRSWAQTIEALKQGNVDAGWLALNSDARARGDAHRAESDNVPLDGAIEGVRAVITGHSPGAHARCTSNVWHIDTGAGSPGGAVTLARIDGNVIETLSEPLQGGRQ